MRLSDGRYEREKELMEILDLGKGNGNPLQYSCLENPMDGEAWQATVRGCEESPTTERLHSRFTQVKKQQLVLDGEQQTGSKLGKEYVKTVYCHPVYLIMGFNWVLTVRLGFPGG